MCDQVMVPCRVAADPELLTFRWSFNSSDNEVSACIGIVISLPQIHSLLSLHVFIDNSYQYSEDSSHQVIMPLIKSNVKIWAEFKLFKDKNGKMEKLLLANVKIM